MSLSQSLMLLTNRRQRRPNRLTRLPLLLRQPLLQQQLRILLLRKPLQPR
jgi:hypothetical protein